MWGCVFGPCFVIQYFVPFWFCNHLDGEERASCFTLSVFLMSYDTHCPVTLTHGMRGSRKFCQRGSNFDKKILN